MIELSTSRLFTPWTNPDSGVTIYLLTEKVAPVQQGFYFVNNSVTDDGRYLWFYCAFPPAGSAAYGRTLGVVDFEQQQCGVSRRLNSSTHLHLSTRRTATCTGRLDRLSGDAAPPPTRRSIA
jgi:hypothetical protein